MKTILLLGALVVSVAVGQAADTYAVVRAAIRAELDRPRSFDRPGPEVFFSRAPRGGIALDGDIISAGGTSRSSAESQRRRADAIYAASWVLENQNSPRFPFTSLAHLLAAAARAPELVGSDTLTYLVRTTEARQALGAALRPQLARLASPDFRAQRLVIERATKALDEMDKAGSVTNQEWGVAFRDLLRALR